MSRLAKLNLDQIPEEYHYLFTDEYLGDRFIFRIWAHNPELLKATLNYLEALYDELTPRKKELIILTVARQRCSKYEWHQHVDISKDLGVKLEEIQALGGKDFSIFDTDEFVLLQYTKAVESRNVTAQIHNAVEKYYSTSEIVAIGLLIDFYLGLCNYIESMDLEFEGGEFIGWTPSKERVEKIFE